jgi:hypothetical protein
MQVHQTIGLTLLDLVASAGLEVGNEFQKMAALTC